MIRIALIVPLSLYSGEKILKTYLNHTQITKRMSLVAVNKIAKNGERYLLYVSSYSSYIDRIVNTFLKA